jgi:hypothetical protein
LFTREEALALWDDLIADKDAFLYAFGELVMCRTRRCLPVYIIPKTEPEESDPFGYFIRAKNHLYIQEMFHGFDRVCKKHNATYRVETEKPHCEILFYKLRKSDSGVM